MAVNEKGFSLVELLVVLALTGIAMTGIFSTFISQLKSYSVQQDIATMQQNLRAAMILLSSELKMAGYDPTGNASAKVESMSKYASDASDEDQASINFTKDSNKDGVLDADGENLTYALFSEGGIRKLSRRNPTANASVADYIDRFHLNFLDANDDETTNTEDVRSVQITLVARTAKIDNDYNDAFSYQDLQGNTYMITADGYRRTALSMQVNCRNLGL